MERTLKSRLEEVYSCGRTHLRSFSSTSVSERSHAHHDKAKWFFAHETMYFLVFLIFLVCFSWHQSVLIFFLCPQIWNICSALCSPRSAGLARHSHLSRRQAVSTPHNRLLRRFMRSSACLSSPNSLLHADWPPVSLRYRSRRNTA